MTYLEALSYGFPSVQVSSTGIGELYSDLVWEAGAPLPSQEALDSWMLANQNYGDFGTIISVLSFRNRFYPAEKVMLDLSSIDNPAAPTEQRQLSASIRVMMSDIATATYIDLTDPTLQTGLETLEYFGMIAPGRAAEIITTPVQFDELPKI